jgi:hypothetical protein
MNRYDNFLKYFLPIYLKNPLIGEIIISDETGEDAQKIYADAALIDPKIRLFVNEERPLNGHSASKKFSAEDRLGPFRNKLQAAKLATNEWIALIDSDNFADEDYFQVAKTFIEKRKPSTHSILAPMQASPGRNSEEYKTHAGFNFRAFAGFNINVDYFKTMTEDKFRRHNQLILLFNTGNFVLHKSLLHSLNLSEEDQNKKTDFFDVFYLNTLLFEQIHDLNFYVIPKMSYSHSIHDDSITIKSQEDGLQLLEEFKPRFYALRQRK